MSKRPLDPVIGSFCASHGYIDEALGRYDGRGHVARTWGKRHRRYYEPGREDAQTQRQKEANDADI